MLAGQIGQGVNRKDAVDPAKDRVKEPVTEFPVDQVVIDATFEQLGPGDEAALTRGDLADENMSSTGPGETRLVFTSPDEVDVSRVAISVMRLAFSQPGRIHAPGVSAESLPDHNRAQRVAPALQKRGKPREFCD